MRALRVIDTGLKPARWNIAVTAALAELHRSGSIPDTLRFHRYLRSVLLGRTQTPLEQDIHAGQCRAMGVEIARRVTGGGAVYMSPGVLAWDIVANRSRFGLRLADASEEICSAIAAGLARLGVPARVDAGGAITVDGRKVSGSSGGFDGPSLIQQGTVLLDVDHDELNAVLRTGNGRPLIAVAGVTEFLGRTPSIEEVQDVLLEALCDRLGLSAQPDTLHASEDALAAKLLDEEIGTDEFVLGTAVSEMPMTSNGRRRRARS